MLAPLACTLVTRLVTVEQDSLVVKSMVTFWPLTVPLTPLISKSALTSVVSELLQAASSAMAKLDAIKAAERLSG